MAETFGSINLNDLMQKAGSNWTGTFGTDSFRPAAIATAEQRATKNAPLNDTKTPWTTGTQTDFTFPSTPMPELNREANFQQNEKEATLAGQRASQQMIGGAEQLSRISTNNYQKKSNIDQNSKNADFQNQLTLLNRSGGLGGGGQSYGIGGTIDPYDYNPGFTSTYRGLFDAGKLATYNLLQSNNARNDAKFYEAQQAGNIALSRQEADNQRRLLTEQQNNAVDMANRQFSMNQQQSAIDYGRQAQEAAKQRLSQQQIAATQASANIYGSMFGALSGPGANYKYWS